MKLIDKLLGHKPKRETVNICIPDESFYLVESVDSEGFPELMVVNASLQHHQDDIPLQRVFNNYCSVMFYFDDVDENDWPGSEEFSVMQACTESFDKALKEDEEHPNALFVARITYKGTCEMIWMIHDSEKAIAYLDGVIAEGNQVREFDYRIEEGVGWDSISRFLQYHDAEQDET